MKSRIESVELAFAVIMLLAPVTVFAGVPSAIDASTAAVEVITDDTEDTPADSSPSMLQTSPGDNDNNWLGLGFVAIGTIGMIGGALIKFGADELVVTDEDAEMKTQYNIANWLAISLGAAFFVVGLYDIAKSGVGESESRPVFGWNDEGDAVVGLLVNF